MEGKPANRQGGGIVARTNLEYEGGLHCRLVHDKRPMFERTAHSCPVHKSVHPDVEVQIVLKYPD